MMFDKNRLRRRNAALKTENESLRRRLAKAEAKAEKLEREAAEFCEYGIDATVKLISVNEQLKKETERTKFLRSRLSRHEAVVYGDCEGVFPFGDREG